MKSKQLPCRAALLEQIELRLFDALIAQSVPTETAMRLAIGWFDQGTDSEVRALEKCGRDFWPSFAAGVIMEYQQTKEIVQRIEEFEK